MDQFHNLSDKAIGCAQRRCPAVAIANIAHKETCGGPALLNTWENACRLTREPGRGRILAWRRANWLADQVVGEAAHA
jgi:hypothetical protein